MIFSILGSRVAYLLWYFCRYWIRISFSKWAFIRANGLLLILGLMMFDNFGWFCLHIFKNVSLNCKLVYNLSILIIFYANRYFVVLKLAFDYLNAFATCTSPKMHLVCPQKFCMSIVFNFSWDDCNKCYKRILSLLFARGSVFCVTEITNSWENKTLARLLVERRENPDDKMTMT